MKYIKLLRLQDQYLVFGIILASSIFLKKFNLLIIYWLIAATSISIAAFIINEIIDSRDVDLHSWNPVHIGQIKLNEFFVRLLFLLFSISGLYLSYKAQVFHWGFFMYLIGILYSLPPFRLKSRFALDILTQLIVFVLIPGLAVFSQQGFFINGFYLAAPVSFIIWGMIFPYQLADYEADKKAGFRNTHTVLGFRNSLYFGLICSAAGIALFFIFKLQQTAPWSLILAAPTVFSSYKYISWLKYKNRNNVLTSMQAYVLFVKPLSQLFIPYLLLWMYFYKLILF